MGHQIDPSWWTHWAISHGKSVRSWCDGSSDRSFMVDPLSYFSFQPVLHNWFNKGRSMCYPVCRLVHIKEPLLLIGKSSPCVYINWKGIFAPPSHPFCLIRGLVFWSIITNVIYIHSVARPVPSKHNKNVTRITPMLPRTNRSVCW